MFYKVKQLAPKIKEWLPNRNVQTLVIAGLLNWYVIAICVRALWNTLVTLVTNVPQMHLAVAGALAVPLTVGMLWPSLKTRKFLPEHSPFMLKMIKILMVVLVICLTVETIKLF